MQSPLSRPDDAGLSLSRRSVLRSGGAATVAGLAGCLTQATDDDHNSHDHDGHNHDSHNDDGHDHDNQPGLSKPVPAANVAMVSDSGHHFDPHIVWIEQGGTVTWEWASGAHDTAAYHPDNSDLPLRIPEEADPWDSEMLMREGETFVRTFDIPGVYDYFCSPHQHRGMVGSIIVGQPDPKDQLGLASPQDNLPQEARTLLAELNGAVRDALSNPA